MKQRLLCIVSFLILLLSSGNAQDIPLFSQKLTNAFIYNPSFAGNSYGSATLSHRQSFGNVQGAAKSNFLSIHTPIKGHRFGMGLNVFQEEVNFVSNLYASGAFAYHIRLNGTDMLSMGVSAEFNRIGHNINNVIGSLEDPVLSETNSAYDFSFGANYSNDYLKVGLSVNRLATSFGIDKNANLLSNFYTAYVQGTLPLRGGKDLIEPLFNFRKYSDINNTWGVGLFYTYDGLFVLGGGLRKGDVISATAGFKILDKLLIGYSYEFVNNDIGSDIGASNEFTLRFDFNKINYEKKYRTDYKSSMTYRRKTLSSPKGRVGAKGPKAASKKNKKGVKRYSPSWRYNKSPNSRKLKKSKKSPSYKKRARAQKSSYKRKSPSKKRRKR